MAQHICVQPDQVSQVYDLRYHRGHRATSIREPPVESATSISVQHGQRLPPASRKGGAGRAPLPPFGRAAAIAAAAAADAPSAAEDASATTAAAAAAADAAAGDWAGGGRCRRRRRRRLAARRSLSLLGLTQSVGGGDGGLKPRRWSGSRAFGPGGGGGGARRCLPRRCRTPMGFGHGGGGCEAYVRVNWRGGGRGGR